LIHAGLKPGDAVGLLANNSPENPVALLGILEAGGICVVINALAQGMVSISLPDETKGKSGIYSKPRFEC
jgi:acyl-CoA synthetase (AMP-forming)/AMP-acid ligase II